MACDKGIPCQRAMPTTAAAHKAAYEQQVAEWEAAWAHHHEQHSNACCAVWEVCNPHPHMKKVDKQKTICEI
ncbi:histone H3 [Histoplasma ohiense]|nr:histone H3 [Histoplasma ohiense (nom. inval.)]